MAATAGAPVFISYSHRDRDEALRIQQLLERNNTKTFLDQEAILAGDTLPEAIQDSIRTSSKLLLIWSINASRSQWVEREWMTAFHLAKRIIPVALDSTPLPDALQNFVYIDRTDREHGDAELFRAVLGHLPTAPAGVDMFPGAWEAELTPPDGSGIALYSLELKANGQIVGMIEAKRAGTMGWAANLVQTQLGIDIGFMFQPTPVAGSWSYTPGVLSLDLVNTAFGQEFRFGIQIYTTGREQGVLHGTGPAGTRVLFRRKTSM